MHAGKIYIAPMKDATPISKSKTKIGSISIHAPMKGATVFSGK